MDRTYVIQVKMITWASFKVLRASLICIGPNMSMAVFENAGKPAATLRFGICPRSWLRGLFRSFLHVTHFEVTVLAILRSPMIQNLFLASCIKLL